MPINYLRGFTAPERSDVANRRLGRSLAFVAGAANAGGFLAVGQYTSHMSGIVSSLADNVALGDLQAMADSALSFFRDDYKDEDATIFDFAGLLRTITDDYGDQGQRVFYSGPDRLAFNGRPFSLRRACMNLVDNALKYGNSAELQLIHSATQLVVEISDQGPGNPIHALEQVFTPFFRLEQSRNRGTGGMGLGLTSARAVVRAHGGDIALRNRECGGLQVRVTLPLVS